MCDRGTLLLRACKAKRNIWGYKDPRDITTTAALHWRCDARASRGMINQAESLIDSRERLRGNTKHRYSQPASNQTSHVLRPAWFRARFSYSYWSPGASPSSWSPRLDFLRIHLEETINHLVARTVRSSVSIFIWRRPTAGRTLRSRRYAGSKFYVHDWTMKQWEDKRLLQSQVRKEDSDFLQSFSRSNFQVSGILRNLWNCNAWNFVYSQCWITIRSNSILLSFLWFKKQFKITKIIFRFFIYAIAETNFV